MLWGATSRDLPDAVLRRANTKRERATRNSSSHPPTSTVVTHRCRWTRHRTRRRWCCCSFIRSCMFGLWFVCSLAPLDDDKLRDPKARRAAGLAKMRARVRSLELCSTASAAAAVLAADDDAAADGASAGVAASVPVAAEPAPAASTSLWGGSGDSSSSWWGGGGAANNKAPPLTYEEMTRAPPPQLGLKYVATRVDARGSFAYGGATGQ